LTIISAHAATEDKGEEEKAESYSKLERICSRAPKYDLLVIMGDFNAKVGREESRHKVSGKYSLHEHSNENGSFLVQFAIRTNFYIKSTAFPYKTIHMGTWNIPGSTEVNQIDHILVSARHVPSIIDVRSSRGASCDSDRYLVKAQIRETISSGWKQRSRKDRRKWNSELITTPEGKKRYQASLEKKPEATNTIEPGSQT
jgi:endonuclease/exonuclease/phosphatase family metal-dependent hydrolase